MGEREATLDEAYAWFHDDVAACFTFLEDEYGFRRTSTRDEGRDGIFIRFRSETTAVGNSDPGGQSGISPKHHCHLVLLLLAVLDQSRIFASSAPHGEPAV
jgi:hypothetical protein